MEDKNDFEHLKNTVDDGIKNKDASFIETIDDENQLRYMQKYIEMLISKRGLAVSFESYLVGIESVILAICAIGISYVLVGVSKYISMYLWSGIGYVILGATIVFLGISLWSEIKTKKGKEFKEREKDIEFMHDIILKIEERIVSKHSVHP